MNEYTMDYLWQQRLNERGEPIKTKLTHPYSYDPITIWSNGKQDATGSVYSDRLYEWDSEKYKESIKKVFGENGRRWDNCKPEQIEKFLTEYFGKKVALTCVTEYCNQATGYPCWRFDYKDKAKND